MAHGFFTIEEWKRPRGKGKGRWDTLFHLDASGSQTEALKMIERHGKPGLFRVVQTQRCVWAQTENGNLRLHGSHASSEEGLARLTEIYEQEKGRRPVEKAREDRKRAKAERGKGKKM